MSMRMMGMRMMGKVLLEVKLVKLVCSVVLRDEMRLRLLVRVVEVMREGAAARGGTDVGVLDSDIEELVRMAVDVRVDARAVRDGLAQGLLVNELRSLLEMLRAVQDSW